MGVRIVGQEPEAGAALYDSVTMTAFGPVFSSTVEADEFLWWYYKGGDDPRIPDLRTLTPKAMEAVAAEFFRLKEALNV